jgi:hypothetical protein
LDRPLKQFAGIVEQASTDLKSKLDSYNREREQNYRQRTTQERFLSELWEESEMNASDIAGSKCCRKITMTLSVKLRTKTGPWRKLKN